MERTVYFVLSGGDVPDLGEYLGAEGDLLEGAQVGEDGVFLFLSKSFDCFTRS